MQTGLRIPGSTPRVSPALLLLFSLVVLAAVGPGLAGAEGVRARDTDTRVLEVMLDPGHGGRTERPDSPLPGGDHWSVARGRFLAPFNFGAEHEEDGPGAMTEQAYVLGLSKEVRNVLTAASTDAGWPRFAARFATLAGVDARTLPRVRFNVSMTREDGYDSPARAGEANPNRRYRLFDSPVDFVPGTGRGRGPLYPGRMSHINRSSPDLVVALHANASDNPETRGASAVITPNFRVFHLLRTLDELAGPDLAGQAAFWLELFMQGEPVFRSIAGLRRDVETYFSGNKSGGPGIGERWKMVMWRYRKDGAFQGRAYGRLQAAAAKGGLTNSFWEREIATPEWYRRGTGYDGSGGDNLYGSQELIRFVRANLIRNHPGMRLARNPDDVIGPHLPPFARDYALPMYVNAVVAYVEVGFMTNAADRAQLETHRALYAEGLAFGIYSLAAGIPAPSSGATSGTRLFPGVPREARPKGLPLSFARYRDLPYRGADYARQAAFGVTYPGREVLEFSRAETAEEIALRAKRNAAPPAKRAPVARSKPRSRSK